MDERILLSVEDSDADFYVIQIALNEVQPAIQLCRVNNGEQAIAFLQGSGCFEGSRQPDIVLLDINMPGKNGFEVLEFMKSQPSLRGIPVVMFTSSSNAGERKRALALGAEQFLTKPSTIDKMIADLKAVCSIHLQKSRSRSA